MMYHIFVVEDDPSIIDNLREFLKNEGFTVTAVSGQGEALDWLSDNTCDLILLDISLSDGNR